MGTEIRASTEIRDGNDGPIRRFFAWLGKHELASLILLAVVAGGAWGFAELADEVIEGETMRVDRALLLAFRSVDDHSDPIGPKWVEEVGRDVTALGGVALLSSITLVVAGFLWLRDDGFTALFFLLAVGSGMLISMVMKNVFDRPRPDIVPHGSFVYSRSFPSGHSAMSAVTYLTLGALLARVQRRRRIKAYLLIVAGTLVVAVGVSRVYLGVHWPTDVLAGWTLGATWAAICWLTLGWLRRSRLAGG